MKRKPKPQAAKPSPSWIVNGSRIQTDGKDSERVTIARMEGGSMDDGNAALIVRAVNAHAELEVYEDATIAPSEAERNADLISAAPELLSAIVFFLKAEGLAPESWRNYDKEEPHLKAVRAAIAKSEAR